jgi:hypothetical protein
MTLQSSQSIDKTVPLFGPQISHLLFYCPSYSDVADQILNECQSFMRRGTIHWNTFEDGFPNLMIESVDNVRGRDVVFLADFLDISSIFAQLSGETHYSYEIPEFIYK